MKANLRHIVRPGLVLAVTLLLLLASDTRAQMNYQGRLTDSSGASLADGSYALEFSIHSAATDVVGQQPPPPLWGPYIADGRNVTGHGALVNVVNGQFNVIIGATDTTSRSLSGALASASGAFLQIKVGGAAPITPRQAILAAPLAQALPGVSSVGGNIGIPGNVGIGRTDPQAKLHVHGNGGGEAGNLVVENAATGEAYPMIRLRNNAGGDGVIFKNSSTRPSDGGANTMTVRNDGGDLRLQSAGGIGMIVKTSSGNVGIGTSTPNAPLEVVTENTYPNFGMSLTGSGSDLMLGVRNTSAEGRNWTLMSAGSGSGVPGALRIFDHTPGGGDRLTIRANGNVGIGTVTPGVIRGDRLEVNGSVLASGFRCRQGQNNIPEPHVFNFNWQGTYIDCFIDSTFVGGIQFLSDRRLKENIEPLPSSALDRVKALRPVSFQYKNIPDSIFAGSPDLQEGFIADELQAVIPSAVKGDKDGLTKDGKIQPQTLNLAPIISVLTKAAQELAGQVESQKSELTDLRAELSKLRSERASLAQTVNAMEARFARLEQVMNKTTTRDVKDASASADVK